MSRKQRRTVQHHQNRPSATAAILNQGPNGGPRTPEGKAVSSQNAFSHGLTAARLVLPWEDQDEFDSLLNQLVAEHKPTTATEGILVREMAEQYWRLQRARNREHLLLSQTHDVLEKSENDLALYEAWNKDVTLTQRYTIRHERAFHKCLANLRTLQKERRLAETEAAAEAKAEAQALKSRPEEFVSQNGETPSLQTQTAPECASTSHSGFPISDTAFVAQAAF